MGRVRLLPRRLLLGGHELLHGVVLLLAGGVLVSLHDGGVFSLIGSLE